MRKIVFAAAAVSLASITFGGAAWAGSDDFECSNATLSGEYAFGVTAYTPPDTTDVTAGIKVFDGQGDFAQRDYPGDSLRTKGQTDFSPPGQETGTYMVNPDCTGEMMLNLSPGHVLEIRFVISNGGRHIHEVVAELTPPGSSAPVPIQTSADDWKVAPSAAEGRQ